MRTVWKYPIYENVHYDRIRVPAGAVPLYVGLQEGGMVLWMQVETDNPRHMRQTVIVPTGGTIPEDGTYAGSAQQGPFVWHLYLGPEETA